MNGLNATPYVIFVKGTDMVKFFAYLVLGVIYAVCALASAVFIMISIHDFKKQRYFLFGLDLMAAIFVTMNLAKLIFKI